ncbi:hypothetical protein [Shewanella decolorationis]|uniref:hypothetical protein n=1 Tax=Shewanella decolorationis TaxID=256839 RepID=UPI001056E926|nr:hypothetical protein [Shewanella decolorationis]
MQNHKQLLSPEIIKRFDFLDSWTPAAKKWIANYLRKEGIQLSIDYLTAEETKIALANFLLNSNAPTSYIRELAKKMGTAWRVRNLRKNSDKVNLTVALNRNVSNHLTQMSKGQNKTNIITLLIEDNYKHYLAEQKISKDKRDTEKKIKQVEIERAKLEKLLARGKASPALSAEEVLAQNQGLKNNIAMLYELMFIANEKNQKIDDAILLEATKIYYSAFLK